MDKTENIIIVNPDRFFKTKQEMKEGGALGLHILADFDRTLTKAFVNGEKVWSLLGILRNSDIFPQDFGDRAQDLFNKYHPFETDASLTNTEKKKLMEEWWQKSFDLMIEFNFNKKHLLKVVSSGKILFREKLNLFLDKLKKKEIPLVIMSASGMGEAIEIIFKKNQFFSDNIFIISNSFQWDENGKATRPKMPIIHSLNKDETLVKDFPKIFEKVKNRENVILLGDNPEDVGMIEGFDFKNMIKIGFLNENTKENLDVYKKAFDVVILNDGDMGFVNDLLFEIVN